MKYNLGRVVPIFKGTYDNSTTYEKLDVVYYNGSSYVANDTTTGVNPSNTEMWQPVAMAGVLSPEQITEVEQQIIEYVQSQGYVIDSDYVHTDNNFTDADKSKLDGIDLSTKQDTLESGVNIKTINGNNILGSGNLEIQTGGGGTTDYSDLTNKPSINGTTLDGNVNLSTPEQLDAKQDTLVSGTNIKTINNESLLGSGNITIESEPAVNPFKGWFDNLTSLQTNYSSPVIGDYAYVKGDTTTDPVKIYECTTNGTWSDSSREVDTSNVQSFQSSESVNSVSIINDFTTGGKHNVLSAEKGKDLGEVLFGTQNINIMPNNQRLDENTTLASDISQGWTGWTSNQSTRPITVSKVDDYFTVSYDAVRVVTYCGLRTDVLPTMEVGTRYIASFYAKNNNGNTTPIAFFIRTVGGTYELSRIELTDDWAKYELEFEYSSEQVTRFQLGPGDHHTFGLQAASFCVKDFALVKFNDDTKKGLVEKVSDLDEEINRLPNFSGKTVAVLGDSISTNGITGENSNVPEIVIGQNDIGVQLTAYLTYYDVQSELTINGHTYTTSEIGTEITFTPTAEDVGKVVGKPNNYNENSVKVWWEVMNEILGTTTIPVCWSGSSITSHESSNNIYKCSYAWHDSQIRKCGIRVEGSMDRIAPDIIIIYRGVNDFSHVAGSQDTYARLTEGYFDNVNFQYPTTDVLLDGKWGYKEGLVLTISKVRDAYPNAKIFLCTLNVFKRINYSHFPTNNGVNTLPQYNNAIREVADYMGCGVIEFDKDGITFENCYPTYISDSATTPTHPNDNGHLVMGKKASLDLLTQYTN